MFNESKRKRISDQALIGIRYDNAAMESFFATLKQELVYHRQYQTRTEAKQDIFEYIQVWYNRKRRHSSLNYMSPYQFENHSQYKMAA